MVRIKEIPAKEGQVVKKGAVLVRFDDREARGNVAQFVARRDLAKSEYTRQLELYQKKFISKQALDQAQSELRQADAALSATGKALAETSLNSPIDGTVLRQDGEVGEMAVAGQVLVWVGKPDALRINAEVNEEDIPRVIVGQRALIKADAFPNRVLEGKVAEITPKGDSLNKIYRVWIDLPKDTPLKISMTTEVNIIVREKSNVILVPTDAVINGKVWVIENNHALSKTVKVGIKGQEKTEIEEGMAADDVVVVSASKDLKPDQRVRISDKKVGK
jgi:RND family efflux transporter MFP subunit